jgi:hypothetical protein
MAIDYSKLFDREVLKGILAKYRKRILKETNSAKDLTSLLMKGTQGGWTKGELLKIKNHFLILGKKLPIFLVFLLPGGFILLPLLIEMLDRRKNTVHVSEDRRRAPKKFAKKN